jgi:group I intron endonuclease
MNPYRSNSEKENCSPTSSNCKIYSLRDPREESIRYIGLTTRELNKRLNEHLSIDCKFYKGNWIKSILKNNLIPIIELIEDNLTLENAKLKEKQYILLYKSLGAKLTNLTNGGEGTSGYKHSNITKEILSVKRKGILNPFYNKKHNQESLCKMSIKQSKENNGFYGKVHTEKTKEIIKEKRKNQIIKTGWNHSE